MAHKVGATKPIYLSEKKIDFKEINQKIEKLPYSFFLVIKVNVYSLFCEALISSWELIRALKWFYGWAIFIYLNNLFRENLFSKLVIRIITMNECRT